MPFASLSSLTSRLNPLWPGVLAGLLILVVVGLIFTGGYLLGRGSRWVDQLGLRWGQLRLDRQLDRCLERAGQLCQSSPGSVSLTEKQSRGLERKLDRLRERLQHMTGDRTALPSTTAMQPRLQAYTIEWTREPVAAESDLPDSAAAAENLERLVQACDETPGVGCLLLIRIDRHQQLRRRLKRGMDVLTWKLARVICRSLRDDDVACQSANDTIMVLMPNLDAGEGAQRAAQIREAINHHTFRVDESGAEVLLTASYGVTNCLPGETFDLVSNRAGNALERSSRRGRNRLTCWPAQGPPQVLDAPRAERVADNAAAAPTSAPGLA